MKNVIAGDYTDSTSTVLAYLAAGNEFLVKHLYRIGDIGDPHVLTLTDYETPLLYAPEGLFLPARITRGTVTIQVGFKVDTLEINWTPAPFVQAGTTQLTTAPPTQRFLAGLWDNLPVYVWTVYMPTPGDANTYGCSQLFGGLIGDVEVQRGNFKITAESFLTFTDTQVPLNVIETTSVLASFRGGIPPAGLSVLPQFAVETGSSQTVLIGMCTSPNSGQVFNQNVLRFGYVVFNSGGSATLGAYVAPIQANIGIVVGSNTYNQIVLYDPLPFPPTPGSDTFYISASAPINYQDGNYYGFPFIPSPQGGL